MNEESIRIATRSITIDNLLSIASGFVSGIATKREQSIVIESLIMRIPLRQFCVDYTGEIPVIVNAQDILAVKRFLDGKLILCDLELLPHLNGQTCKDFSPWYIRRIKESAIVVHSIEKCDETARPDIIKRLVCVGKE